jgi:uncharacterized membrane protein YfcA
VTGAIAIGVAGGIVAGLLGVGGGVLFVPGLVFFLGLNQHHAEATSLLAIVPVALVGTYRQDRFGNVQRADALLLGLFSVAGAACGVALANALTGVVLRDGFAALMVLVAYQLVHKTLRGAKPQQGGGGAPAEPGRRRVARRHRDDLD